MRRPASGILLPLVAGIAAATAVIATAASAAIALADDGDGGTHLVVTVIDSSASPTATPTSSATSTGTASSTGGSTSATGSGVGTTAAGTTTQPAATSGTPDASTAPGVLYVSGLTWVYRASLNPFGGSLELRFTVRNVYSKAVDASARFWVTQVFGGPVGQPVDVAVAGLKPGETRTVAATVDGLAAWTVVSAHVTLTPPAKVGVLELGPITRDTVAWFAPWPVVLLVGLAGAWLVWRRVRARRVPAVGTGEAEAQP